MKRIAIVLHLVWLCMTNALAQASITGSVVDSVSGEGLAKATVVLIRGGKTMQFARTDDKGQFSIDIQPQHGDELQATRMGYGKKRQPVGKSDNTSVRDKDYHKASCFESSM